MPIASSSPTGGYLLSNIVLFGRLLRAAGIEVRPNQIIDFVTALRYIDLHQRSDVKNSARTIFISRSDQRPIFDRAFDLFWQASSQHSSIPAGFNVPSQRSQLENSQSKTSGQTIQESLAHQSPAADDLPGAVYTYSDRERLRHKNFSQLEAAELAEIERLMGAKLWRLGHRSTRRKTPTQRQLYLDLRRTMRKNLRHGPEWLQLVWQGRQRKPRPLVVIADISGSMVRYSRLLLKFIYIISRGLDNVEAFVFATRLTRLTHQLQQRHIEAAFDEAVSVVQDWGSGTRIGECLKRFNYDWGRRVLGRGAIVLIISDGWDRGDNGLLDREMGRLHRSCHRLIWLNPLLGSENYQPLTRGIQTILPHVDDFLPVHNLVSLEQLGALLAEL